MCSVPPAGLRLHYRLSIIPTLLMLGSYKIYSIKAHNKLIYQLSDSI